MPKYNELVPRIFGGASDKNIALDDRGLLLRLGFAERTRGSHHIYRKVGIEEELVLQREAGNARIRCARSGR